MRVDHNEWMYRDFEEHPLRRPRGAGGWWVAAAAAVVAVVGAVAFLSVSPSFARLAAHGPRVAEGRTQQPPSSRLASAPSAGAAEVAAQSRIQPKVRATETAAQAGAASANATAQDASATAPAPQP